MEKLGSLQVYNTKDLISPDTRICSLIYSGAKFGKTKLAASLNEVTKKYRGKPSLFIACEVSEGGGTMSVADLGVDYVQPATWGEMEEVLGQLATNDYYGGVILDNATDYVIRIVRPYALKFPAKERELGARQHGVPVRSDYQTMSECSRQQINKLLNLTNKTTPEKFRKDVIVTALEREQNDDDGKLEGIKPALPGALADVVTAMFQSVVGIKIKQKIVPIDLANPKAGTKRVSSRILHVANDGVRVTDDRTGMWPHDFELTDADGKAIGLMPIYEAWLARMAAKS